MKLSSFLFYHVFLTFIFILITNVSSTPLYLNNTIRSTVRSDVIGRYTLHPDSSFAANPNLCPRSITTYTFEFAVSKAPPSLPAPSKFNIRIPHVVTAIDGNDCESSGSIMAVTSTHPFVKDVLSETVQSWATGGKRTSIRSVWVPENLIEAAERLPWAIGYDFSERSCNGATLRAGAAFMWFQPKWSLTLDKLQITGRNKYLLITFSQTPRFGCVYVADIVGGQDDFEKGPVSDPSIAVANQEAKEQDEIDTETEETTEAEIDDDDEKKKKKKKKKKKDDDDEDEDEDEEKEDDDEKGANFNPLDGPTQDDSKDTNPENDDSDDSDDSLSEDDTIFGSAGKGKGNKESAETDAGGIFEPNGETPKSDEATCFPASAKITLHNGKQISMQQLQVGHRIFINMKDHSPVYFFSHKQNKINQLHDFVKLYTKNGDDITLSPGHYIYCDHNKLCSAASIRPGDKLIQSNGQVTKVIKVQNVRERGLFAPHTLHGDIVVNKFKASTYTTTVHPYLAHNVLLMPIRLLYHLGLESFTNGLLDNGAGSLVSIIPKGPDRLTNKI